MEGIKSINYEDGVIERFYLQYGDTTLQIGEPDGWDSIDCAIRINEEFFNVEDFILGETQKFKILQYDNLPAFNLINQAYQADGGDAVVLFRWEVEKDGRVHDILGAGYQLNLNKYRLQYERSGKCVELEIKRRESNNKLLAREDISTDLFSQKDLDDNPIDPMPVVSFYYKERDRTMKNFYFFTNGQIPHANGNSTFFSFTRGDDWQIGENTNADAGFISQVHFSVPQGPFIFTNRRIDNISVEFSNFHIICTAPFTLEAWIGTGASLNGGVIPIKSSVSDNYNGTAVHQIKIVNEVFPIGSLPPNSSLWLMLRTNDGSSKLFASLDEQASIEISSTTAVPLRKSQMVRLSDAIDRIAKMSTAGEISLKSRILQNSHFKNSAVGTGMFLRGFSDQYFSGKLKTSLKEILYDCASPLMALGFDVADGNIIVEDVDWFFKNAINADFSTKPYDENETIIEADTDSFCNKLVFGSSKYSTGQKGDLKNFNTKFEALTPIQSSKKKFEKVTDFVIDDFKIQSIILDPSTNSKNTDDDLVLVDMVEVKDYLDTGILADCVHFTENGRLALQCFVTPFDTMPIKVGDKLTITSGINAGTWDILEIKGVRVVLNRTTGIQTGTADTPISYIVKDILKSRSREGFYSVTGQDDEETSANIRHNPKYQMARWFGFFGGSLSRKQNTETIKVTDYVNNGAVTVRKNTVDSSLANEIGGLIRMDDPHTLQQFRTHKIPYFTGEIATVKIYDVEWYEFLDFYQQWRNGDNCRGYVRTDSPIGIVDVFPFGTDAVSYDRGEQSLTIKGKIKNNAYTTLPAPDEEPEVPQNPGITEVYREETECGSATLEILLPTAGTYNLNIEYTEDVPEAYMKVLDITTNTLIGNINSPGSLTQSITITGATTLQFTIRMQRAALHAFSCVTGAPGEQVFSVGADVTITGDGEYNGNFNTIGVKEFIGGNLE